MSNKTKGKVTQLIMCCICANAYHVDCHWPAVMDEQLKDPKWKCESCCPNYTPYNGEADAKNEPKFLPRKSKAGRKKRAISDPDGAAVAAKKAALQQNIDKNETIENSQPIDIDINTTNNNNNNSNNINNNNDNKDNNDNNDNKDNNDSNANKPSTIVSQTSDNADVVQVIRKDNIHVVKGIIDLAPLTNYSSDTSLPPLTLIIPQEDKDNDDSLEIIENGSYDGDILVISDSLSPSNDKELFELKSVNTWSIDEVVSYIEKFYPNEAEFFRDQEIDGAALMVLSRQDVIDRFGLKLGPALRLYELVLSLQTSMDDVTIAWCD